MITNEEIIYIKESDVPLTKTRKQLLRYFLRGQSYKTYSNKECTKVQCNGKGVDLSDGKKTAFRSITDLHAIVKSRFPKTSLEGIVKIIYEFINEDKNVKLVWCNHIEKVTVRYCNNPNLEYLSSYSLKNYYTTKGVDGYSLEDYNKIIEKLKN